MRITDSRYDRDRLRLQVAFLMIRNEARTCTIRVSTGLSDDRIRKLYRSYFGGAGCAAVRRRRGKSPRQMAFFRRSPEHEIEAATLAGLLETCGLIHRRGPLLTRSLEETARFCTVYETFRSVCPRAHVSFEHAWYLLEVLSRDDEYTVARCTGCGGLWVRDRLSIAPARCAGCRSPPRRDC
jgi:hypothetical protein